MDKSNDVKFMEEYLRKAMTFEKYAYTWKNALNSANNVVSKIQKEKDKTVSGYENIEKKIMNLNDTYEKGRKKRDKSRRSLLIWILIITSILLAIITAIVIKREIGYIVLLPELVILPAIFVWWVYRDDKYAKKYTSEEKTEEQKRLLDTKEEYKNKRIPEISTKLTNANSEKEKIESNLAEANSVLEELYSQNVLPPCYRNFVAVSTFYQYITTYRCTQIKGHGGIYDTYENDSYAKLIITNLQQINAKIDDVIAYQRLLFEAVKEANSTLQSINKELHEISVNVEKFERQSEITELAQEQSLAVIEYRTRNIS